jgi:hypothetical protein
MICGLLSEFDELWFTPRSLFTALVEHNAGAILVGGLSRPRRMKAFCEGVLLVVSWCDVVPVNAAILISQSMRLNCVV